MRVIVAQLMRSKDTLLGHYPVVFITFFAHLYSACWAGEMSRAVTPVQPRWINLSGNKMKTAVSIRPMRKISLVTMIAATTLVVTALIAQQPLSFEVVSIKQADTTAPGRVRGVTCRGVDGVVGHPLLTPNTGLGRCRMMGTYVKQLISSAYGVGMDEIVGGPSWLESLPYTIEARAADPSSYTKAQLIRMIRPLLTDRFKLQFHNEVRQTTGYSLAIAKNGPKLKLTNDGQAPNPPVNQRTAAAGPGKASTPGLGMLLGPMTTAGIAANLALRLHAPITDDTGLTGKYSVELHWTPDELAGDSGADRPPSLFVALQEQLGLRLEPAKVPINTFVIDHAEKPAENF